MKSRNLMMGVFIAVVMQGIARAQPADLTRTVTLKPSTDYNERNDNWPFKLAPTQTATYNVTIQGQDIVGGVLYKLKEPLSPPNFTPAYNNPGFLWAWKQTGGTATSQTRQFKVVNTVWEEKTATVVVKCTWKPVGTGSAGCTASVPSPDLDGEAKGTARHQVGRLMPTSDLDIDGAPDYLCINEEITLQSWLVTDTLPDLDPFLVESSWSVAGIGTSPGAGTIAPSPEDTVTFTPSSAGRVKVTATYTGDGNHSDTVEFYIVSVVFDQDEVRPGIPENRKSSVIATISPKQASSEVSFVSSDVSRATVDEESRVDDYLGRTEVNLNVQGVTYSAVNRDTQIETLLNGDTCETIPITVVKPASFYSSPLEAVSTTPAMGQDVKEVVWYVDISKTILDDYDEVLLDNWNGMKIYESIDGGEKVGFEYPNGDPLAFGSINDPVRAIVLFDTEQEALDCINGVDPHTSVPTAVEQEIYAEYPEDGMYRNLGSTTIGLHVDMNEFTVTNTQ